jgi:hypothetical protein
MATNKCARASPTPAPTSAFDPSKATARAWRVTAKKAAIASSTKTLAIHSLDFYSASDCEALPLDTSLSSGRIIASDVGTSGNSPSNVFDADSTTFWQGASVNGQDVWVGMEFFADVTVRCAKIRMSDNRDYATELTVEALYSNDLISWKAVKASEDLVPGTIKINEIGSSEFYV